VADEFIVFDEELKRQVRDALELAKRARAEINRAKQYAATNVGGDR
jgi:hypothetical protein